MNESLQSRIRAAVDRFVPWLDAYGESSQDQEEFYASRLERRRRVQTTRATGNPPRRRSNSFSVPASGWLLTVCHGWHARLRRSFRYTCLVLKGLAKVERYGAYEGCRRANRS